jgi:hypothetical protein
VAGAPRELELEDCLPPTFDGGKWTPRALGKLMSTHQGKFYGKPLLALRSKDRQGMKWWSIQEWAQ